jgi:hypothetical protein
MSKSLFKSFFIKCLCEDIAGGDGGAFGDYSDGYAPGDARIPSFLGGGIITRNGLIKRKKKRKKRKKRKGKK